MKYLKIFLVVIISFCAVFFIPEIFANDTLTIENITKSGENVKIDDYTTELIIAILTAIVNLVIHLFGRKKNKNK